MSRVALQTASGLDMAADTAGDPTDPTVLLFNDAVIDFLDRVVRPS